MRTSVIRDLREYNQFRQTIQSKPPRLVHGGVVILVALLTSALVWAMWTRVNLVVRGAGRVRPVTVPQKVYIGSGERSGGKVAEVGFRQGQEVRKGDLLLRLDTERIKNEIARKKRTIAAGEEELEKSDRLAELQQGQAEASVAKLTAEIAQAVEEVKNAKDRQNTERRLAEAELRDAQRDEAALRRLVALRAVAATELDKAVAKSHEIEQKLQKLKVPIEEGKVAVARKALTLAEKDFSIRKQEQKIKQSLKQAEVEAARLEVAALELDLRQVEVRAPLGGVVTSSDVTVGDVIQPGAVVAEIAEQHGFRFELSISSEEIAHVKPGMPVKIKLEAFDFQKYGTVDGTIDFVAPDSAVSEGRPGASYLVRVKMNSETVGREELTGQIKLGMAGLAEVVTDEESLLALFFKKIRQSVTLK